MASNPERLEEFKQELRFTAVQYRASIDSGDMYHAILQFAAEAALPTPGWADAFTTEAQIKALEKRKELWERRYSELREEKRKDDELGQDPVERTKRIHDRLNKDKQREAKLGQHNQEAKERGQAEAKKRDEEQRQRRRDRKHQATERQDEDRLNKPRPTQMPA